MFYRGRKGITKLAAAFFVGLFVLFFTSASIFAASIAISYTASKALPMGTLVAIDNQNDGAVVPADNAANSNLLGVVVDQGTASVSSASEGIQVDVSSRGTAYVLVSNLNGVVAKGTPVTSSPLEGIGMASNTDGKIVGIAQSDLNDQSLEAQYKTVKNKQGEDRRVLIALVPVALDVTFYQQSKSSESVPKFLRDFSRSISDKEVSPVRIWGSVVIIAAGLIIALVILYGAVRSSIGAIGRNPLAKSTIQGSLIRVILLAATVLIISVSAVYLILKG